MLQGQHAAEDDSWMAADVTDTRDRVFVRFSLEPRENEAKSATEGRPIFDEVEYVEIQVPGDKTSTVHRPITSADKARFAQQYKAWKAGATAELSGTPLAQWPIITRAQVEELAFFGVRSVEALAAVSDSNLQRMGHGARKLRGMAQDFLVKAKGGALEATLRTELEAATATIENQNRVIKEMGDRLSALEKKKAKE